MQLSCRIISIVNTCSLFIVFILYSMIRYMGIIVGYYCRIISIVNTCSLFIVFILYSMIRYMGI